MPSKFFFRAKAFPITADTADLRQALEDELPSDSKLNLVEKDIAFVPSCPVSDKLLTVLFSVKPPLSGPLEKLVQKRSKHIVLEICDQDVVIDVSFYGFTQMFQTPAEQPIIADIIALAGLNGHAYGSWKAKDGPERMWLRDFMRKDFSNCRILVYGYNADLKAKAVHKMLDYSREFLNHLTNLRKSKEEQKRPILFIGHDYGGLLIAHTLVKAKLEQETFNDEFDCILKATVGIIFFGTPHRGMLVQNFVEALQAGKHTQRLEMLNEIGLGSIKLEDELRRFIDLCTRFKICSVYETEETAQVAVDENDDWKRGKEYKMAVEDKSTLLHLPEKMEHKIPANADHSNIVKFESSENETYKRVCEFMRSVLPKVSQDMSKRFALDSQLAARSIQVIFQDPIRRNEDFVGRVNVLKQLHEKLAPDPEQPRISLRALGGSGKTEIAVEFCHQRHEKVPTEHIFWIFGDSLESFTAGYRDILEQTQPELLNCNTNQGPEDDLLIVKSWLENDLSGKWLMVIDNLDDIDIPIGKYLPQRNGAILFTNVLHLVTAHHLVTAQGLPY